MPSIAPRNRSSLWRRAVQAATAATALLLGTAASAQEQLVMPYACSVSGGYINLRPAQVEAHYRIYGEREQRSFTVCSPVNPNVCRTWLLHRFQFDCGGQRVDWMSTVEAAAELTTGRAWVDNGRLHMRMNPYWARGAEFDDPCPRWRRSGRFDNECSDRGMRRNRGVVEMPPGFAPALGIPVRFASAEPRQPAPDYRVGPEASNRGGPEVYRGGPDAYRGGPDAYRGDPDSPYRGGAEPAYRAGPDTGYSEALPGKAGAPRTSRVEPPRDPWPTDTPPKSPLPQVAGSLSTSGQTGTPSAGPQVAAPKQQAAPRPPVPAATEPSVPVQPRKAPEQPKAPETAKSAEPKASEPARTARAEPQHTQPGSPGQPAIVPKIINRPDAGEAKIAEARPQIAPQVATRPELKSEPQPAARPANTEPTPAAARVEQPADSGQSMLTAYAPSSTTQAIVGFVGLVGAALGLFVWTRRREQLSLATTRPREFGAVRFDGRTPPRRPPAPVLPGPGAPRPQAAAGGVPAVRPQTMPQPASGIPIAPGQMPRNREEACQVLGASADAGDAALKKIVDGLRQSWHPDLATSEADRNLREHRTAQINVAWDILSGRQSAA